MKMKINLFLIMILIFSVGVSAFDYTFTNDDGNFNSGLTDISTATRTLNTPVLMQSVDDFNNDGINEVMILDSTTIRLYQSQDLTIIDSYNIGSGTYKTFDTYDIDNDGYINMIFSDSENGKIHNVEYNGTGWNDTIFTLSGRTGDGLILTSCQESERCLALFSTSADSTTTDTLKAQFFNSTSINTEYSLLTLGGSSSSVSRFCLSSIPYMDSRYDIDLNGLNDYISTWTIETQATALTEARVHIIDVELYDNNTPYLNNYKEINQEIPRTTDCTTGQEVRFTSPLVANIDGSVGNGYEVVVGVHYDSDEFKMYSYNSDLSDNDDYPELFLADGQILSNVILFNAFDDTDKVDFCVLGYRENIGEIDLLCASEQTGELVETVEFNYDISSEYNISTSNLWNNVIHSTDTVQTLTNGNNLNELVTNYGIFSLDYTGDNELIKVFDNPKDDGVVLLSDVEGVGLSDMLVLTDTNLWYIDDGYTNAPAEIDAYYVNPCIDSVWKVNTSVEVRITPKDDTDTVRARAVLYSGTSYEQDSGYTAYGVTGTTFSFPFVANVTGSNIILSLYATDSYNNETVDNINFTLSVGVNGVEFGECITDISDIIADTETETETNTSEASNDNALTQSINNTANVTGLGTTLTWLLFMGALALVILLFDREHGEDMKARGITISICETIMLIMGIKLGFISAGIIWILVIISIVGISFWIGRKIQSPTG